MATAFAPGLGQGGTAGGLWVEEDRQAGLFKVSRDAFVDDNILAMERDRIFSRCWLYIGHSSELRSANDYVTRSVGGRELIFNRDRKGQFGAFFNSCPHRGAMVARGASGNALGFKCFYHGWTFNNNGKFALKTAPGVYPPDFGKDGCVDLVRVPRLQSYRDFWFVNFDAEAVDLEVYLAEAKALIDIVADQSADGMEIIGGDHQYSLRANWKLLAENSYDGYHAHETHSTYLDFLRDSFRDANGGVAPLVAPDRVTRGFDLGNGHAAMDGPMPWGRPVARWVPTWGEQGKHEIAALRKELDTRLGKERGRQVAEISRNIVIFPNLVINDIMAVTVRTFYPEAPGQLNVNSWALGPVGESAGLRRRRLDNFLEFLGPGGLATPDDIEALESCQTSYRNRDHAAWNDLSRGMLRDNPAHDDEAHLRAFWREWARRMGDVA